MKPHPRLRTAVATAGLSAVSITAIMTAPPKVSSLLLHALADDLCAQSMRPSC